MTRHITTTLFALFFLTALHSQTPAPRASAHLFYFRPSKSLLLIDGYESAMRMTGKSEIWQWNGGWKKVDSSDQPLRALSGAAYNTDNDQLVVYGGIGNRGYEDSLKNAWIYNGKTWKMIEDRSIGTRDHHEMVYDQANKMIVSYGGQTGQREFDNRTWLFKDNRWKSMSIPSPGRRAHHAMAYDAERKKTVLYGGSVDESSPNETWEFDGAKWVSMAAATNPGARSHHSMVYDPVSKKVLLYGGDIGMNAKGDVWAWDGKTWVQLTDGGPQRILAAIAFDPDKNKLYVFGGNGGEQFLNIYSDLWEWDQKKWTRISKGDVYKFDMEKKMFVKTQE